MSVPESPVNLVVVEGGVLQGVYTSLPGVRGVLVDWDADEGEWSDPRLRMVPGDPGYPALVTPFDTERLGALSLGLLAVVNEAADEGVRPA